MHISIEISTTAVLARASAPPGVVFFYRTPDGSFYRQPDAISRYLVP
jgi:hypothetical protein